MMIAYLNGQWLDAAEAGIPIDDRGFLNGDAVFETGRLADRKYFRLREHLRRLADGAAALRIDVPPQPELIEVARGLAERNDLTEGALRITVTRGRGEAGPPTVLGTLAPLPADWRARAWEGWRVVTASVTHPPASSLAQVKTPGRIHGLVARLEAKEAGADDALLLSPEGFVTEGPSWNIFWREGGHLYTPSLDLGVLEGVTRTAILELAPRLGLEVVVGQFPAEALDDAEEAFATMTSLGIVPFRTLDGRLLPEESRDAARWLTEAYWELVGREGE
ncbi:MAG TPA: aminotransferase class IV [Longimicrobiales bacterium]|nr:aminotransferase class IV [Longimicrobiales bacterium]